MEKIRDIADESLFAAIARNAEYTTNREVCGLLALAEKNTDYTIYGLFACRATGVFMGARIDKDGETLKTIEPAAVMRTDVEFSNPFGGVGAIGHAAGAFMAALSGDPLQVTSSDLFGDYVKGEPDAALTSNVTTEIKNDMPTEMLLGVCDKMRWIAANDENGDSLSIDWVFGPGWVAVGGTISNNGKVVNTLAPVSVQILESEPFYDFIGRLCNQIAGNALAWMIEA